MPGSTDITPAATPPTNPPTNLPIAVPIFSRRFPAATILLKSRPLTSSPSADSTRVSSPMTSPNAAVPIKAAGAVNTRAANPFAIRTRRPRQAVPLRSMSGLIFERASIRLENISANMSTIDLISRGVFLAIPSSILIRKLNARSTIFGVYFTRASNTPTTSFKMPSAM